jgi:hypothetical protein
MIDVEAILQGVDLVDFVARHVALKPDGQDFKGLCPFHDERTASFYVVPSKGFAHCFGCGWHGNAIGFVMRQAGLSFVEACRQLGAGDIVQAYARLIRASRPSPAAPPQRSLWIPIAPVPEHAPRIVPGAAAAVWNPKRGRRWQVRPTRADEYRDAKGRLIGYVLRVEFAGGQKITPQITWCVGADGSMCWCTVPFPRPRPLCGLDALESMPEAPVLIVEGEKCRGRGIEALPQYAVVTWPGGSRGVGFADWTPLRGRDLVLWPDADQAGREAMLGWETSAGILHRGVAQHAHRAGCKSIRMIDPAGQPKGWDLADALDAGWTARQLATWAAQRVVDVEVAIDVTRRAA